MIMIEEEKALHWKPDNLLLIVLGNPARDLSVLQFNPPFC